MSKSGTSYESRPDVSWLLITAATAAGERGRLPAGLWEASLSAAEERGRGGTGVVVDSIICDRLLSLWEGGWQPVEVVRAVRRRRGGDHADLCITAVAASHTTIPGSPPRSWGDQLADLGAAEPWWGHGRDWLGRWALRRGIPWVRALRTAAETLGVLSWLLPTEMLIPPPSKWDVGDRYQGRLSSPVDEVVLTKVRALLAKAESTNFEHEADALTAKAQELMARHAIDRAVAESGEAPGQESPSARRMAVDDPYANAKSSLLAVVASANGARAVWDQHHALMTLVGFESDLDAVEMLFTSLLMQGSRSMLAKGRIQDARGRSRTRSFRQSFFVAFGQRIHERLVAAASQARETAERDLGRNLLPVLAGRTDVVDDFTDKLFPRLSRARASSVTNPDGWLAGRAAAEMATLGPVQRQLGGTDR